MNHSLVINETRLSLEHLKNFVFKRKTFESLEISPSAQKKIEQCNRHLHALLEKKVPIYGVTTGFGDSSFRFLEASQSEELQRNLVAYLNCGTGPIIPEAASRATFLIRLNSLCKGYSGVSMDLVNRMKLYLERDWIPVTPREGSLGASGDLVPLAYLARIIQGEGLMHAPNGKTTEAREVLSQAKVSSYTLKPKEGLALVNGTSTMAGLTLINLNHAHFLLEMATLSTAWLCIALKGRTEAFDVLINEKAKAHPGQTAIAQKIRHLLEEESYVGETTQIQDKYSLRCSPQILGPILETIEQGWNWLETEVNSASDNPLIDEDGNLSTGGNFYGGYLAHSMDYLKISLANMADLLDRQLMLLADEKSNRGLTPNLADWSSLPEHERFLHHGLKGLHQSVSAITSEIMAKATPNSIFSRSSECHNQDKVSLGMSAAVQCHELIQQLFNVQSMVLICLAQGLDLRKVTLKGKTSVEFYDLIRKITPQTKRDTPLGSQIQYLSQHLNHLSEARGESVIRL